MGISVRKSIGWPPAPHAEPTSTVVLTSPKRWFVDLRVLLLVTDGQEDAPPGNVDGSTAIGLPLTADAIDWAFAGTSSSAEGHSVWRHWVDSRTEDAEAVRDEGDCEVLPDGTILERGSMVNPATGVEGPYEEVWIDLPLSTFHVGASPVARCVVLRLQEDSKGMRGVVVRLGQFCQGILRTASGVTAERWQWETSDTASTGSWRRSFRFGAGSLPCDYVVNESAEAPLEAGALLDMAGAVWSVTEAVNVDAGEGGH